MHAGEVICAQGSLGKVNADRHTPNTLRSCYAVIRKSIKGPLVLTHGLKEGVQCMLVKLFARKAVWLKLELDRPDRHTPKTPRSTQLFVSQSKALRADSRIC